MKLHNAQKIGGRQGLLSAGIGVTIAQLSITIMSGTPKGIFSAFFWFVDFDYQINILIGIIILFICSNLYGQMAGWLILIKKWNAILTGILIGSATLLTSSFLSGWTGFFQEGISDLDELDDSFFDYIVKPMYWITLFGAIPAIVVGIWLGFRIKKKGRKCEADGSTSSAKLNDEQ